jgi:hypothetical protein
MTFRSLVLGLPLLVGLAALPGCGAAPGESEPASLGVAVEPIKGGYNDTSDTNVVDIIWYVQGAQDYSECSGSLLAPNMVLTARHCVANILNMSQGIDCSVSKFGASDKPGNFYVSTAAVLAQDFPNGFHTVREVLTPPGPSSVCGQDQAILILSDSITDATPLVPRVDTHIALGESYSAIGFGNTNDTAGAGQRRRRDNLAVSCVGSSCDAPGIAKLHEFVGGDGTCEGDSGGPAMDGQGRVVGVLSRGNMGCINSVYGDVWAWGNWISTTAIHAAQVGGYDAPPWTAGYPTDPIYSFPVGDVCPDAPAACASGLCLGDAAGSYCTRVCADNAPCPDGYTCDAIEGQQICNRVPTAVKPAPTTPTTSSGCSINGADPTKPVPWVTGAAIGLAALALLRRRPRGPTVRR